MDTKRTPHFANAWVFSGRGGARPTSAWSAPPGFSHGRATGPKLEVEFRGVVTQEETARLFLRGRIEAQEAKSPNPPTPPALPTLDSFNFACWHGMRGILQPPLWMDEIQHHQENPGMMIPLPLKKRNNHQRYALNRESLGAANGFRDYPEYIVYMVALGIDPRGSKKLVVPTFSVIF